MGVTNSGPLGSSMLRSPRDASAMSRSEMSSGRIPATMRVVAVGAITFDRIPYSAPSSAITLDNPAMPALADA